MAVDHRCRVCGSVHPGAREVTLHDGRVVSDYSEDWRAECEASMVLSLPTKEARRFYLFGKPYKNAKGEIQYAGGIAQLRGKAEAEKLAAIASSIFNAKGSK